MKAIPRITIVTPAYNAERTFEQTATSVLAQTREDWEWIVVDDGSTDRTREIAEAVNDSRVKVFRQPNAGASAARNLGLEMARGDYLTFLDADDTLPRNALELRAGVLENDPDTDIVHGAVRVLKNDAEVRVVPPDLQEGPLLDRLVRLEEGVFVGICYMVRRGSIGAHRFRSGLSHCEDLIFFLDLAYHEHLRYAAIPDIVYEYHVERGSAMSNLDGLETGYLELLRHVARWDRVSVESRRYLLLRVQRILFRSWLRRGHMIRALRSRSRIARLPVS